MDKQFLADAKVVHLTSGMNWIATNGAGSVKTGVLRIVVCQESSPMALSMIQRIVDSAWH